MYEEFFGFSIKPFNVTPDPRFLYLSPAHREALAAMIYGINERRGFVSIVGEVGTGKTTLLHTLLNQLDNDITTVFIFNTKINFNELLQNILIDLDIAPTSNSKPELLNQLNDFLIEKLSNDKNVALIIDEAQNLSTTVLEELRMLSNLETPKEKLLQIILVGQPELDIKLYSPELRQLRQRIGINAYLTPFDNEEQLKYISHRLNVANSNVKKIFSPQAFDLICKHSNGIPRIINILCDNALLAAYGKEHKQIDAAIMKDVIADYERSPFPITPAAPPAKQPTKTLFNKSTIITFLLMLLITLIFILGISIYKSAFNAFNHYIDSFVSLTPFSFNQLNPFFDKSKTKNNASDLNERLPGKTQDEHYTGITSYTANDNVITPQTSQSTSSNKQLNYEIPGTTLNSESIKKKSTMISAKKGDTVGFLALQQYGTFNESICDIIQRANPELIDLDKIEISQNIYFPTPDINTAIIESEKNLFCIHIATFSSLDNAQKLHHKLLNHGYPSVLSIVSILGDKLWHRVTIGNFSSRLQAIEYANKSSLNNEFTSIYWNAL